MIQINVNHRVLTAVSDEKLVAKCVKTVLFEARFDAGWDGYERYIVFTGQSGKSPPVLYTGGVMEVPWQALDEPGVLWISAVGLAEGKRDVTALMDQPLYINYNGSLGDDMSEQEPNPMLLEQAVMKAAQYAREARDAVSTVDRKIEAYMQTHPVTGKPGPKGDPFTYEDFTPEQLEDLRGPAGPSVDLTAVEKKIEKNRVDISDLKNVLIRKTAEGSVIPVTDCADFPLMKFEMDAAFEGVGIDISSINRMDCTQVKCKDGSIPELYGNGFIINPVNAGVNAVIVPCHLKKGISYSISFDYKFLGEDRHDFNFYLPEEGVNIPASITPIKDVHYLGLRADGNYVGSDNALQVTNFLVRQEGTPKVWTPYREETTVVWNGELTPELRTLDVPTVISNRAGGNMRLEYVADPVKYIDNKITELAALTLEV